LADCQITAVKQAAKIYQEDFWHVRPVISLEAESIKFRKLRIEEALCRFVASLQNIVWFTMCKQ